MMHEQNENINKEKEFLKTNKNSGVENCKN